MAKAEIANRKGLHARHYGDDSPAWPIGIEPFSGVVIGFVVSSKTHALKPLYITGDTVLFDGVAEVQWRFEPGLVLIFAGAAQTRGKFNLTVNANDAIEAAAAFPDAAIIPVHTDGWAHFTESGDDLEKAFRALGHGDRLRRLQPGIQHLSSCRAFAEERGGGTFGAAK
jgi:hypothetical protein